MPLNTAAEFPERTGSSVGATSSEAGPWSIGKRADDLPFGAAVTIDALTHTWQNTRASQTAFAHTDVEALRRKAIERMRKSLEPMTPDWRITGMQKWEGRIIEVEGELFTAELTQATEPGPVVLADFRVDQLAPEREIRAGDMIYVTVRAVRGRYGNRTSTSSVRLRRLGKWTDKDVSGFGERGRARLESLDQYFD